MSRYSGGFIAWGHCSSRVPRNIGRTFPIWLCEEPRSCYPQELGKCRDGNRPLDNRRFGRATHPEVCERIDLTFAKLVADDGYTVARNGGRFDAERLRGVRIIVIPITADGVPVSVLARDARSCFRTQIWRPPYCAAAILRSQSVYVTLGPTTGSSFCIRCIGCPACSTAQNEQRRLVEVLFKIRLELGFDFG